MCLWSIFLISDWCLFGGLHLGARIFIMAQDLWDCSGTSLWVQEGWQRHGYPLWVPRWHQKASGPQAASRYLAQVHTTASSTVMSFPSLSLLFWLSSHHERLLSAQLPSCCSPHPCCPCSVSSLCLFSLKQESKGPSGESLVGWVVHHQGRWLRRVSQPAH